MAEPTEQQMGVPPGEGWQWAFSYLRQDVLDLRAEFRTLRREMQEFRAEIRAEIAEMNRRIDRHFSWSVATTLAVGGLLAALIKL